MRQTALALIGVVLLGGTIGWSENWPAWRGPRGDGTSLETRFPVEWSTNANLQWRTSLPGTGHASPIVWGEQVFTVTALRDTEERLLVCLDRRSGGIQWQQTVLKSPLEKKHGLNSHASSTPATDGEQIYTAFLDGDTMLAAAHSLAGEKRWTARPGRFSSMHGFCSSPILFRDLVILNGDHDGEGYLVALDRRSGEERWRVARPNHTRSYCAPAIFEAAGRTQMVLSGTQCISGYNPADGSLLWIVDGPTEQFVASIVYSSAANLFFVTGGFPDHHVLALRPDGTGNVTDTHVAWHHEEARFAAYVPSPIASGDYFLVVSDPGYACCFDARTGDLQWRERFGSHHASLVSAAGLVYFLDDKGVTRVVRPGPTLDLVAENPIGEQCFASPALSEGQIFLRGFEHLICIGPPQPAHD